MKEVIFDSSFLMAVGERPTSWEDDVSRIFGGFRPIMLATVKDELGRLASRVGRKAAAAKVALEISRGFRVVDAGPGSPDDEIVSTALRLGAAVATVDKDLSLTLSKLHVPVVTLHTGRVEPR